MHLSLIFSSLYRKECYGNKVQGCMLSRLPDQDTQMAYVGCQMQFGADRSHRTCVEGFGVAWSEIMQCVESGFATQRQLDFERHSSPVLKVTKWVPTIVYNGQLTENSHTGKAAPLKNVLCGLIANNNQACYV